MKLIYSHKANKTQKHSTKSLLQPPPDNQWKQPYKSNTQSRNTRRLNALGQDANSIIEKLIQTTQLPLLQAGTDNQGKQSYKSNNQFKNARLIKVPALDTNSIVEKLIQTAELPFVQSTIPIDPLKNTKLLVDTEGRIFTEVLQLVDQIDSLKSILVAENELVKQMKIENPEVQQLVRYHGFDQKLTAQQCKDLQQQNAELQKMIQQIQFKQVSSLEQVLKEERRKYQDLKMGLLQSSVEESGDRMEESHINQLKDLVASLKTDRESKLISNFPEIQRLKQQNEQLRQKTVENLKATQREQEEEAQLQAYLQQEERNRTEFMQQLQIFKENFHKMKAENAAMRERLTRLRYEQSKENSSGGLNKSNKTQYKSLQIESRYANRKSPSLADNLGEYESIIRKMQGINR